MNNGGCGLQIRSSRYTAWNFLPRQLMAQFSKFANLWVTPFFRMHEPMGDRDY